MDMYSPFYGQGYHSQQGLPLLHNPRYTPETRGAKLFAKNFPADFNDYDLLDSLTVKPRECRIKRHKKTHRSLGSAVLTYENPEDARYALQQDNCLDFGDGFILSLSFFRASPQLQREKRPGNMFIKGIPKEWTERQLSELCRTCGDFESLQIRKDSSGASTGYGYVQFLSVAAAKDFQRQNNGKSVEGETISVEEYVPRKDRPTKPSLDIFVGNLPSEFTEAELRHLFEQFGNVISTRTKIDDKNRVCGFVTFEREDEVREAITAMDGFKIGNSSLMVRTRRSKAELRNERKELGDRRTVHIHLLPATATQDHLKEIFEFVGGPVESVFLPEIEVRGKTLRSGKFGRVTFTNEEDAKKVIAQKTMVIDGTEVSLRPFDRNFKKKLRSKHSPTMMQDNADSVANLAPFVIQGAYFPVQGMFQPWSGGMDASANGLREEERVILQGNAASLEGQIANLSISKANEGTGASIDRKSPEKTVEGVDVVSDNESESSWDLVEDQ